MAIARSYNVSFATISRLRPSTLSNRCNRWRDRQQSITSIMSGAVWPALLGMPMRGHLAMGAADSAPSFRF
jgi:hypothetical protein